MTIPWTCNGCGASGEINFAPNGDVVSEVLERELASALTDAHDCLPLSMTILMPMAPLKVERRGVLYGWTA